MRASVLTAVVAPFRKGNTVNFKISKAAVYRALGSTAVLSALAAGIMTSAPAAPSAHAAPAVAASPLLKTCEAYSTWYYSRTTAHIDAMMAGTFTGNWTSTGAKYVIRDAAQLYEDVRAGAAAKWIALDIHYMGTDCNKYALPLAAFSVTVTPAERTCTAFRAWLAHPTAGRLNTVMRDSVSAPWRPLGADVVVLFTTLRNGDTTDRASAVSDVTADCRAVR